MLIDLLFLRDHRKNQFGKVLQILDADALLSRMDAFHADAKHQSFDSLEVETVCITSSAAGGNMERETKFIAGGMHFG